MLPLTPRPPLPYPSSFWPSLSVLIVGESSWPSSRPTPRRTPRRRRHCFQSRCFCSLAWVVHYDRNCKISSKRGQVDILPRELFLCWLKSLIKKMFLEIGIYYCNFYFCVVLQCERKKCAWLLTSILFMTSNHQFIFTKPRIFLRKLCVMIFF